jgi:hypothetical protein
VAQLIETFYETRKLKITFDARQNDGRTETLVALIPLERRIILRSTFFHTTNDCMFILFLYGLINQG